MKIEGEMLDKLHSVEMEILDEIDKICKENNINYFLTGGSMLGAIRHGGFIPWDDDMDIGMAREDYDRFIEVYNKNPNPKYYLDCFENNKKYYLPFAKLKKNNTIFLEEAAKHVQLHKGIFVDIIPFENAKKEDSFSQKLQAVIVRTITETMFYKNKIGKKESYRHPIADRILGIFPATWLMRIQSKFMKMHKDNNSKYLVALAGTYGYKKETNPREFYLPTKDIQFEDRVYCGMNMPDKYLSRIFGDYMTPPPVEKRVNHGAIEISFGDE